MKRRDFLTLAGSGLPALVCPLGAYGQQAATPGRRAASENRVRSSKPTGLVGYGSDAPDLFRRLASVVRRVLQGEKPAEIPVEQPTKFDLVVNLKTAKALDIAISESFLLRANTVIE